MGLNELEKYQLEILIERLRSFYSDVFSEEVASELKEKMIHSNQDFITLSRELNTVFQDQTKLEELLFKYQLKIKKVLTEKAENEVEQALNMSEVTDFTRDGKTYIKITYGDGRIQIIENRSGKDTKQIFEDVQRLNALNNIDGTMNAEAAFRELLKDYREVSLDNTMFLNQEKLEMAEQSKLNFVQMNFPNNQVFASTTENIFIIKGNPDITVEVVEKEGRYTLKQVGEASYGVKEERQEKAIHEMPIERSNEVKQENWIIELEKITEGMTEEEIVEYLRIHGKNPSQIMMILLSLEEAKASKKEEQQVPTLEKPKQKILTNTKGKMAAFVDTLYLSFLVGMISGAIFFAMLRFILHSL